MLKSSPKRKRSTDKKMYYQKNKATIKAKHRTRYLAHKKEINAYGTEYHRRVNAILRREVLKWYGEFCSICGDLDDLRIDHIGGHKGEEKYRIGPELWRWIKKNGYPAGFRTLCNPCNVLDGFLRKHPSIGIQGIDELVELQQWAITQGYISRQSRERKYGSGEQQEV